MTHNHISIATIYSSAQCVLSVVGSVGVILLFAGIPQLIYSPSVSAANLITFVMGAVLITTMVAGNSILNYKHRSLDRTANRQGAGQGESGQSAGSAGNQDDKPPSYESVFSLDGLPPEYSSVVVLKPPRYEETIKEVCISHGTPNEHTCETQSQATPQPHAESSPTPGQHRAVATISIAEEEEDVENGTNNEGYLREVSETAAGNEESEDTERDSSQRINIIPSRDQLNVVGEAGNCVVQKIYSESET